VQVRPHTPVVQTAVESGPEGQMLPQLLQLLASVLVLVSQPLATLVSQLAQPGLQLMRLHCPIPFTWVQFELALGRAQVSPQKLQFLLV